MFEAVAVVQGAERSLTRILLVLHNRPMDSVGFAVQRSDLSEAQNLGEQLWSDVGFSRELMTTALAEAAESDLITGERPERYSPASSLNAGSLGFFESGEEMYGAFAASSYRLRAQEMLRDGSVWFTLEENGDPKAAVAFGADSFILPVPAGTQVLSVVSDPTAPWERESEFSILEALAGALRGEVSRHIMWRLYYGANTARFDGGTPEVGGLHRLLLRGTPMFGLLVGRLVYSIPMDVGGARADPFAAKRLHRSEWRDQPTTRNCPDIELVIKPVAGSISNLVIAVHGTMSTAVPLAAAARAVIPPGTPVVRFEHDTWAPIHENASALVQEVRRLGARHVVLVAHSRGGLVARHAAQKLRRDGVAVTAVTLGTPFGGTPIIDGVQNGLLGVRVLLGGLRTVTASEFVDPATRILGWLLKANLPAGLSAMSPESDYIHSAGEYDATGIRRFAGIVEPPFRTDAYGLGFLSGFAQKAFNGNPHDLVVGLDSATEGVPNAVTLSCDHFSYFLEGAVSDEIARVASELPPGFFQIDAEPRQVAAEGWLLPDI